MYVAKCNLHCRLRYMQDNIAGQQSPTGLLASWLGCVQGLPIVYSSVCRSVLDARGRGRLFPYMGYIGMCRRIG